LRITEYQAKSREKAVYTEINDGQYLISYPICGLFGEIGELIDTLNQFNIESRKLDKDKIITKHDIIKECSDICWYISNLGTDVGIRFNESDLVNGDITHVGYQYDKLLIELGKIGEATKKLIRDNNQNKIELVKNGLLVILYWVREVLSRFDCSLEECFQINYDKLKKRQTEGKLRGDGSTR
jgi:hypothetical protein